MTHDKRTRHPYRSDPSQEIEQGTNQTRIQIARESEGPAATQFRSRSPLVQIRQPTEHPRRVGQLLHMLKKEGLTLYPASCSDVYCCRMFAVAHPSSFVSTTFVCAKTSPVLADASRDESKKTLVRVIVVEVMTMHSLVRHPPDDANHRVCKRRTFYGSGDDIGTDANRKSDVNINHLMGPPGSTTTTYKLVII